MQVFRNWDGPVIHEAHQNRPRARARPRARKAGLGLGEVWEYCAKSVLRRRRGLELLAGR
jgi:hypothetical protein